MAEILDLFSELRWEVAKVVLLLAFLDATTLFLLLYLVGSVFSMGLAEPLVAACLFFIARMWLLLRRYSLRTIEQRNPEVREMLRTASDNRRSQSVMAQALFGDVILRVRKLSSGTLLSLRAILSRVAIIFVLSMLIVTLGFFNINIQKFHNPLQGVKDAVGNAWDGFFGGEDAQAAAPEDFGEPKLITLGQQQLDVEVSQSLSAVDFTNVQQADALGDVPEGFPGDAAAKASEAYTGGLQDITDRKTAADYSQEIKK